MSLVWTLAVDWNNDGVNESAEGGAIEELTVRRGREALVRADGKGFEVPKVGECVITLRNADGRFDPLNAASALYPNVKPGCDAFLQVTAGGVTYDVFRGSIAALSAIGSQTNKKTKVTLRDGWEWLRAHGSRLAVSQNVATDAAIAALTTDMNYPAAWGTSLDTGSDTLPYWWAEATDCAQAINDLVTSEYGYISVAADGTLTFLSRASGYNPTSAVTLTEAHCAEVSYPQPWESIRNIIDVSVHTRAAQPSAVLWTLDDKPSIAPYQSLTYIATFKDSKGRTVPAQNLVTPVASTDYTGNSAADGTGVDLTAALSVSLTAYGESAAITITHTGAPYLVNIYVTLLQLRGEALTASNDVILESDNSSGSAYGMRKLTLDLPWQQNVNTGQALADWLASLLSNPLAFPIVRLTPNIPATQFGYDLNSIVTLNLTTLGINAKYRIGKVEHRWNAHSPNVVDTVWLLEPVDATAYWVLGTSELGTETRLAY